MKTIKTVLAILLLILSLTSNAQEKQNNATWEETVQFLAENIQKFDLATENRQFVGDEIKSTRKSNHQREIKNEILFVRTNGNIVLEANLKELISVDVFNRNGCNGIFLEFNKNAVKIVEMHHSVSSFIIPLYRIKDEIYQNKTDEPVIQCSRSEWDENDEFVQRMLKAFKHLAYLANEKRSKSKF